MTRSLRVAAVAVVGAAVVVGCVKRAATVPPESSLTLAGKRATWRDWTKVGDLCAVDPVVLGGDLDSMGALLLEVLGQTSADADGMWAPEHIALLEEALRVLPAPLDATQQAIHKAQGSACHFEGLTRAGELAAMGRRRLAAAPELLATVKAKAALAAWREARPAATERARQAACPPRPPTKKELIVFYAAEDEKGRVEWLFCDGHRVFATPGQLPAFEPGPAPPKKRPPPRAQAYLDAAAKFPPEQVSRAPKLPIKRAAKRHDDAPEPE